MDGTAFIDDDVIIIRLPISHLPMAIEGMWAAGYSDVRYKVTNAEEFAQEFVRELNKESEDGTTMIHSLFDKAALNAIDQGAFGIEEHEDQEGETIFAFDEFKD